MPVSFLSAVFPTSSGGSVTVPSGAQGVIAFTVHLNSGGGSPGRTLSSISLQDAGSFTIATNTASSASGAGVSVSYAAITATGSKTFSYAFSGACDLVVVGLAFVNGVDTGDWITDTGTNIPPNGDQVTRSLASATTNLVLAFHARFDALPAAPSGWTSRGTRSNSGNFYSRLTSANSPGASTTTYTGTGSPNDDALGMVSIKEGASPSIWVQNPKPKGFLAHMAQ